ncbi:MAG: DUF1801 domain-containing protein [Myxococcaceae bacterium]|nr:DUF1801 domain-containing protein [Myxococcaceae bacterium]
MAARKSAKRGKAPKAKSKVKAKRATGKKAPPRKKPAPKKAAPKKPAPKKPARKKVASKTAPKRKVYPKVTLPELPEIEGYVRSLPPPVVPIVNRLRQLVRDAAPEARELLDPHGPAYDANGLFARIEINDREVLVTFLKGAQLDAPEGTLAGGDGDARAVLVDSLESLRESVLQALVRQAVLLNVRDPSSGAV